MLCDRRAGLRRQGRHEVHLRECLLRGQGRRHGRFEGRLLESQAAQEAAKKKAAKRKKKMEENRTQEASRKEDDKKK